MCNWCGYVHLSISILTHPKAHDDPGMGGLCCALALVHYGFENIEVFETASNLGFVGAGIQLAPNMSRILDRLGVWKDIEKEAVLVKETSIRGMLHLQHH
jgi:hypothetical protein